MLQEKIAEIETILHLSQQECEDLKSKHVRAAAVLSNVARDETGSVDESVKKLVEELESKRNHNFTLEQEKVRLQEEMKSLEEGKISALQTNRKLSRQVEDLQREISSLHTSLTSSKESLKRLKEESSQTAQRLERGLMESR